MENKKERISRRKNIILLIFLCITIFISIEELFRCYLNNSKELKACSVIFMADLKNEYKLYNFQNRLSPFSVFPADDEKNIGQSKRGNLTSIYDKEIYLTFDDGPSKKNTLRILDILIENDVKASFFVIGDLVEKNIDVIKMMKESGMCILPHSYSHQYSIYNRKESYFEDLNKNISVIENIVGEKVPPYIRMPGGSDNAISNREVLDDIKKNLRKDNIRYVDWNVGSLDANNNTVETELIKDTVINKCSNSNFGVVLMHDANTKATTVEALPDIIKYLKAEGFVFRTFTDITPQEEREMIMKRIINK